MKNADDAFITIRGREVNSFKISVSKEAEELIQECLSFWKERIPPNQITEQHYIIWLTEQLAITRQRLEKLESAPKHDAFGRPI